MMITDSREKIYIIGSADVHQPDTKEWTEKKSNHTNLIKVSGKYFFSNNIEFQC